MAAAAGLQQYLAIGKHRFVPRTYIGIGAIAFAGNRVDAIGARLVDAIPSFRPMSWLT
jgi:hypothetical protein